METMETMMLASLLYVALAIRLLCVFVYTQCFTGCCHGLVTGYTIQGAIIVETHVLSHSQLTSSCHLMDKGGLAVLAERF